MSEWETKTLGEVAQIERGKFSHRPRNEPRFYGGNTPFVQTGDVTRSNGIVRTHTQTLNEDGVAISKVFPAGTILITIAANIGYAGILEFDSAAPDSLIGLTPDDTVSAEFLNFYLRTQQPEMDRMAPKGTQKNINIQFLKPWPVVVPPLPEQKKIAHILSTVQRAIEAQERIIQTTTELKKALMHKLFTEGLRNEPQKQTEIGSIPDSWEVVELGEVAKIERGKFSHRPRNEPRFYGGEHPFVQTGDVSNCDGYVRSYTQTLNEDGLAISKMFPAGTILITIAANIGFTGILEFDSACPDSLIGITPKENLHTEFLNYYLITQRPEMDRLAPKGTQKNINIQFLKPWPVPLPSFEQQTEIAEAFAATDRKIRLITRKRTHLQDLFHTLLHELMTAKTRVANIDLANAT